ncbi:type II secretion system major pseudopilin GspG [Planctomycetota bacterium]
MKTKKHTRRHSGFSMMELMAVLIILGLLFAVVAQNFGGAVGKARVKTTKTSLKALHNAVKQFYMDTGRYPTEEEGLDILIDSSGDIPGYQEGGYLDTTTVPLDGWNNEFVYEQFPESGKPFVIKSYGADGEEGGEEGDALDLLSTDAM